MATIKLVKRGAQIVNWAGWLDDNELCTLETSSGVPPKEHTKQFRTEAAAQAALDAMVAKLKSEGFASPDAAPAEAPKAAVEVEDEKPSKPWAKAERPAWFAKLPEPLAKQHAKITKLVRTARLEHRTKDVESLLRPAIAFKLKTVKAAAIPVGVVTRFGGDPDLPAQFAWPKHGKSPLAFLAQFRLEELKEFDLEKKLPAKGLLSVFAQMNPDGDDYAEVARVFYFDDAKKLARHAPEHDAETDGRPEKACLATPSGLITVPGPEEPATATLKLTSQERERYLDDVFNTVTADEGKHQLLGWGTATSPDAHKKGFELLLQIDSDEKLGLEIGDVETLRVFIDTKKLAAKDFFSVRASCAED